MSSVDDLEPKISKPEKLPEVTSVNQRTVVKTILEPDVQEAAATPTVSIEDSVNELVSPLVEKPSAPAKTVEDAVLKVATEVAKEAEKKEKESDKKITLAKAEQKVVEKELVAAEKKITALENEEKIVEDKILKAVTPEERVKEQLKASKIRKDLAVAEATVMAAKETVSEIEGKKEEAVREKEEATRKKKESKKAVQKAIQDAQTKHANVKLLEGISTTTVSEFPNMCIGKFVDTANGGHVIAMCSAGPENTCPSAFSEATCIRLESIKSDLTNITLKKGW